MTLQSGGGSYKLEVLGDNEKNNWGKMDGETIIDTYASAIEQDAKADGYKIVKK